MPYLYPTWPPPLSAPEVPHHSSVLSVTRPVVASATRPPLPSAHQPAIISATRPPLAPAPQPPVIPAIHPALPSDHQFPMISANYPDLPSAHRPLIISAAQPGPTPAHQPPVASAKYPKLFPAHQSPMFPDTQVVDTQNTTPLPRIPANHTPLVTTSSPPQPPVTRDVPILKAQAGHHPVTSPVQPSRTTAFRSPVPPAHQVPVPAASQAPASHTPLPPRSSTSQTSLTSAPHPRSKVPQAPREGALGPSLAPWLSSAVPTSAPPALGEASPAGRSRRDERWLLVALLVPTCVFLVVLLALGIVYCTRCGPHAPNKRVTDCYRWVTHAGSKGPTEPAPHRGSLTGVQTCRTSV